MQNRIKWSLSTTVLALFIALMLLSLVAILAHGSFLTLLLLGAWLLLGFLYYRKVYKPYVRVERVMHRFLSGRTTEELFALPYALTPEMPHVLAKVGNALDRQRQLRDAMKQAEFLALQNQINPHFLYNTLEAIRGDALQAGLMNIVDVAEALATYFRYTISRASHLVTLADELRNVESYFAIQKYRYGDRVNMRTLYAQEDAHLLSARIPKLTLQPIVENAITHGLEPKVSAGHITIRFECTKSRLLIEISDDGIGVSKDTLDVLTARLSNASLDLISEQTGHTGGIGLVNVNNRLRLLFGEQYGITLNATPGIGTDVMITLPLAFDGAEGASL